MKAGSPWRHAATCLQRARRGGRRSTPSSGSGPWTGSNAFAPRCWKSRRARRRPDIPVRLPTGWSERLFTDQSARFSVLTPDAGARPGVGTTPDFGFQNIIGRSRPIVEAVDLARRVAAARRTTVLLIGETGTGKELFARGVHYSSAAAHEPFVAINCAAIPESLLESELFGHEKGAFTGAHARKQGLFELASAGTIFLDEI